MTRTILFLGSGNEGKTALINCYPLVRMLDQVTSLATFNGEQVKIIEANSLADVVAKKVDTVVTFQSLDCKVDMTHVVALRSIVASRYPNAKQLVALNKADCTSDRSLASPTVIYTCAVTGYGCDRLAAAC